MTHEQALEVLKRKQSVYWNSDSDIAKALTIAIEVMEAKLSEPSRLEIAAMMASAYISAGFSYTPNLIEAVYTATDELIKQSNQTKW